MSRFTLSLSLCLFFGFAGIAIAQPPGDASRKGGPSADFEKPGERGQFGPRKRGPGMGGPGSPGKGMAGPSKGERFGERKGPGQKFDGRRGGGGHPVERWLTRLEEQDPDLHTELIELRSADPAKFMIEVRKHLMDRMPPGRRWGHGGGGGGGSPRDARGPSINSETLIAIREAAAACRTSRTPETEGALKELLQEAFDTRQAQQRKRTEELESELAHIRRDVADRDAKRDEILQRNFDAILSMDPPPRTPPPPKPAESEDDSE